MATTLNPIYLVGGSKGGVGKRQFTHPCSMKTFRELRLP
jgi:hypothetical protein